MKLFEKLNKIKENILQLFKTKKKTFLIIVALIIVCIVIFISALSGKNKSSKVQSKAPVSISNYVDNLETKIENIILSLDSVKSVSAFVMVDSLPKIVYLTNSEETSTLSASDVKSTTKNESVVFEKNGSVSTPITVTTIMPKVTGVLIVLKCNNAATKIVIKNAISVVLNIDESCISILQEN